MFENKVVRRIPGSEKQEGTGESRRLHNQELHNLYYSCNSAGHAVE
jgi:hypothetical protein